jgi:hypothetical protein
MREIYRRAFAAQAQEALIARPGQDEAELATSMGIELSKSNSIETFRKSLGLARDRQAIHLRDGKYYEGSWKDD